ncbi:translation initiation factor IF-3 [Haloimpatiens sp. FM7330]|uniref:translation initiation factor IF-3 n=1 Tax=Haloimpatiens sp. FM7330 TaxID=3298610 RepID=UPI003635089A
MNTISKGKKKFPLNGEIRASELRVIGDDGTQIGIISSREALNIAVEKDLDLVMISPNAKPPVCRIMDYGKFIYEQAKREKEAKKKQKVINIKEVRLSAKIEEHDLGVKANNARKFLLAENKVKVTVRFRGREADYSYIGRKILDNFYKKVEDVSIIEKRPRLEGRNMIMILAPRRA